MPFKIGWLDEKLHIYDIVLSDPFTLTDQDQFFAEFFKFMDAGPVPMFGVFDVSRWSQSGAAGLNDPRFRRMGEYRKKILVIVMVTKNKVTAAMGRLGAAVVGYRDWMRFEESREKAIKYLNERATTEMTQRGLLPKEQVQAPKEQVPPVLSGKEQVPKEQAPKEHVPSVPVAKEQAPKEPVPSMPVAKEQAPKEPVPSLPVAKEQAPKEPVPSVPVAKEQAPKEHVPSVPVAKEQAPKEPVTKEQVSKEQEPKDQIPKT